LLSLIRIKLFNDSIIHTSKAGAIFFSTCSFLQSLNQQANLDKMDIINKSKDKDITFFCFTPLVSLATFFIEFALALLVFLKYRQTLFNKISIATLICLGLFQLSEYFICTTNYADFWIKVGYVAITFLPAFGVHLITAITRKHDVLMVSGYLAALLFTAAIIFVPGINLQTSCQPNYVAVAMENRFSIAHTSYYAFYVFAGLFLLWNGLRKGIGDSKEEKWLLIAYATFLIPSEGLALLRMISNSAVPSVMCGFAVLAAIILVLVVIPRQAQLESRKKKKSKRK